MQNCFSQSNKMSNFQEVIVSQFCIIDINNPLCFCAQLVSSDIVSYYSAVSVEMFCLHFDLYHRIVVICSNTKVQIRQMQSCLTKKQQLHEFIKLKVQNINFLCSNPGRFLRPAPTRQLMHNFYLNVSVFRFFGYFLNVEQV